MSDNELCLQEIEKRIMDRRKKLGLTQEALAEKGDVTTLFVSYMQRSLASRCKSSSDGNRGTCRFSNLHGRSISSRRDQCSKTSRPAIEAGLLVCYVLLLRFQLGNVVLIAAPGTVDAAADLMFKAARLTAATSFFCSV